MAVVQPNSTIYSVVINHEEQYSIWPADREVPTGWEEEGTTGTRQESLDYIYKVWTDMRPKNMRLHREFEMQSLIASDAAKSLPQIKR